MPGRFLPILLLAALTAAMLASGGPGAELDRAILFAAQQGALVPAARIVTRLGDWWAVLLAAGVVALWLGLRGRWRAAAFLALLALAERALVALLKLLLGRDRPDPAGHLDAVYTMAFPSGHSANAMALGLGLALLAAPLRWRGPAVALGLAYAAAVGLSRLVLGVHWPSDVVGGWAVGALSALLVVRLADGTARRPGGTSPRLPSLSPSKENEMNDDRNEGGSDRAETARRTDDSNVIDRMSDAPDQGGRSGGNLQRDIGTRAELNRQVEVGDGVTRVRGADKREDADGQRSDRE